MSRLFRQWYLLLCLGLLCGGCSGKKKTNTAIPAKPHIATQTPATANPSPTAVPTGDPSVTNPAPTAPATASTVDNTPRKLYQKEMGISFDPPEGWQIEEAPNTRIKVAIGPMSNGMPATLTAAREENADSLDAYMDQGLAQIKSSGVTLSNKPTRQPFTTNDGEKGYTWVLDCSAQEMKIHIVQYLFAKGKSKYLLVGTSSIDQTKQLDPLFEKSAKTIRLHTG